MSADLGEIVFIFVKVAMLCAFLTAVMFWAVLFVWGVRQEWKYRNDPLPWERENHQHPGGPLGE